MEDKNTTSIEISDKILNDEIDEVSELESDEDIKFDSDKELKMSEDESSEDVSEEENKKTQYVNFNFNEQAIKDAIQLAFKQNISDKCNTIKKIHKNIEFYYNSLNLCLGKQGSGKTTFLMKQLIKLDTLPDQGRYEFVIYVTNGGGKDETFDALSHLVKNLPIHSVDFTEIIPKLEEYFSTRNEENQKHIFVVLEDATFLMLKENTAWSSWMTKLRHLRMTVWVNLHVWKSINTQIKSQVTCSFIFKGYSKENVQRIYSQSSIGNYSSQNFYALYQAINKHQCLKVDNFKGEASICQL